MTFGELVTDVLLVNCRELAKRMQVSYNTANGWMNGRQGILPHHRRAFLELYGAELRQGSIGIREILWPESMGQTRLATYRIQIRNPNDHGVEVRVPRLKPAVREILPLGSVDGEIRVRGGVRIEPFLGIGDKPVLVRISVVQEAK